MLQPDDYGQGQVYAFYHMPSKFVLGVRNFTRGLGLQVDAYPAFEVEDSAQISLQGETGYFTSPGLWLQRIQLRPDQLHAAFFGNIAEAGIA